MAIVQTGSVLQFPANGTANTGTVSTTITVPADAELVVVGWTGFSSTSNYYSGGSMTFTKGGVDTAMTAVAGGSTANWSGGMFYLALPDTGSNKTLKWDWIGTNASDDTGDNVCSVTFWKGVDTASPVRSTGTATAAGVPFTTGTITALTGDLIIAWAATFVSSEGAASAWSNLSTLSQITFNVAGDAAWATGSPSGNTTVGLTTFSNSQDGTIWAISVKPTASVAITVPQGNLVLDESIAIYHVSASTDISIFLYSPAANVNDIILRDPTVLAATGVSRIPLQGDLVLSQTAPTVAVPINIVPLQGNLVLSPTAETIVVNINRAPLQGNLVLSPTAETVVQTANFAFTVPQGNLALSPTAETVVTTANRNIVSPQGNLVLSPTAETVVRTANFAFTIPQGNVALSPTAPAVATGGASLVPSQGNVTLSTLPPVVLVQAYTSNLCTGGAAFSSSDNPPSEDDDKAFDGNKSSTKWLAQTGVFYVRREWVTLQLSGASTIASYTITSSDSTQDRDPAEWYLEGSNNGTTWVELDSRTGVVFSARNQTLTYDLPVPGSYLYLRWTMTAFFDIVTSHDNFDLAEIEYWTVAGATGTNVALTGTIIEVSHENAGEEATHAFNGVKTGSDKWGGSVVDPDANYIIGYDFLNTATPTPIITKYTITSGNDAQDVRDFGAWKLEASNDFIYWTLADTRTGETFPSRLLQKDYFFKNTVGGYRYWRIRCSIKADGTTTGTAQLEEVEFMALVGASAITPLQGNLVLSPTAPTVQAGAGINRTPSQGDLVLSPTAPTVALSNNRNLTAPQGNVVLSEVAPVISISVTAFPVAGNIVLSPTAPIVAQTFHRFLVPLQGNVALTTVAAGVVTSANISRVPLQGNLALSPTAETVVLSDNRSSLPLQGNVALSGTAPIVAQTLHRNITVPQGNSVLSAEAPSAGGAMSRLPPQGNVALSGTAPVVVRTDHRNISPVAGNVLLSTVGPTCFATVHHPIVVPRVDLVLSTLPAQLQPGTYQYPIFANLGLTTSSPIIIQDRLHPWCQVISLQGSKTANGELSGTIGNDDDLKGDFDSGDSLQGDVNNGNNLGGSIDQGQSLEGG